MCCRGSFHRGFPSSLGLSESKALWLCKLQPRLTEKLGLKTLCMCVVFVKNHIGMGRRERFPVGAGIGVRGVARECLCPWDSSVGQVLKAEAFEAGVGFFQCITPFMDSKIGKEHKYRF